MKQRMLIFLIICLIAIPIGLYAYQSLAYALGHKLDPATDSLFIQNLQIASLIIAFPFYILPIIGSLFLAKIITLPFPLLWNQTVNFLIFIFCTVYWYLLCLAIQKVFFTNKRKVRTNL
jgi:hypothetical protein